MPDRETVKALGAELPQVEVDRWYGTPALKVGAVRGRVDIRGITER